MRALIWVPALTLVSLAVMAVIDRAIGDQAEFLNAWSVLKRLVGYSPDAAPSAVYQSFGAFGEFLVVLLVNFLIASALYWLLTRLLPL